MPPPRPSTRAVLRDTGANHRSTSGAKLNPAEAFFKAVNPGSIEESRSPQVSPAMSTAAPPPPKMMKVKNAKSTSTEGTRHSEDRQCSNERTLQVEVDADALARARKTPRKTPRDALPVKNLASTSKPAPKEDSDSCSSPSRMEVGERGRAGGSVSWHRADVHTMRHSTSLEAQSAAAATAMSTSAASSMSKSPTTRAEPADRYLSRNSVLAKKFLTDVASPPPPTPPPREAVAESMEEDDVVTLPAGVTPPSVRNGISEGEAIVARAKRVVSKQRSAQEAAAAANAKARKATKAAARSHEEEEMLLPPEMAVKHREAHPMHSSTALHPANLGGGSSSGGGPAFSGASSRSSSASSMAEVSAKPAVQLARMIQRGHSDMSGSSAASSRTVSPHERVASTLRAAATTSGQPRQRFAASSSHRSGSFSSSGICFSSSGSGAPPDARRKAVLNAAAAVPLVQGSKRSGTTTTSSTRTAPAKSTPASAAAKKVSSPAKSKKAKAVEAAMAESVELAAAVSPTSKATMHFALSHGAEASHNATCTTIRSRARSSDELLPRSPRAGTPQGEVDFGSEGRSRSRRRSSETPSMAAANRSPSPTEQSNSQEAAPEQDQVVRSLSRDIQESSEDRRTTPILTDESIVASPLSSAVPTVGASPIGTMLVPPPDLGRGRTPEQQKRIDTYRRHRRNNSSSTNSRRSVPSTASFSATTVSLSHLATPRSVHGDSSMPNSARTVVSEVYRPMPLVMSEALDSKPDGAAQKGASSPNPFQIINSDDGDRNEAKTPLEKLAMAATPPRSPPSFETATAPSANFPSSPPKQQASLVEPSEHGSSPPGQATDPTVSAVEDAEVEEEQSEAVELTADVAAPLNLCDGDAHAATEITAVVDLMPHAVERIESPSASIEPMSRTTEVMLPQQEDGGVSPITPSAGIPSGFDRPSFSQQAVDALRQEMNDGASSCASSECDVDIGDETMDHADSSDHEPEPTEETMRPSNARSAATSSGPRSASSLRGRISDIVVSDGEDDEATYEGRHATGEVVEVATAAPGAPEVDASSSTEASLRMVPSEPNSEPHHGGVEGSHSVDEEDVPEPAKSEEEAVADKTVSPQDDSEMQHQFEMLQAAMQKKAAAKAAKRSGFTPPPARVEPAEEEHEEPSVQVDATPEVIEAEIDEPATDIEAPSTSNVDDVKLAPAEEVHVAAPVEAEMEPSSSGEVSQQQPERPEEQVEIETASPTTTTNDSTQTDGATTATTDVAVDSRLVFSSPEKSADVKEAEQQQLQGTPVTGTPPRAPRTAGEVPKLELPPPVADNSAEIEEWLRRQRRRNAKLLHRLHDLERAEQEFLDGARRFCEAGQTPKSHLDADDEDEDDSDVDAANRHARRSKQSSRQASRKVSPNRTGAASHINNNAKRVVISEPAKAGKMVKTTTTTATKFAAVAVVATDNGGAGDVSTDAVAGSSERNTESSERETVTKRQPQAAGKRSSHRSSKRSARRTALMGVAIGAVVAGAAAASGQGASLAAAASHVVVGLGEMVKAQAGALRK